MKILLINNEFPPIGGGGSVLNYEVARQLVKMGHTITLITSSYKDLPRKEVVEGFQVIRVPALRKSVSYSTPLELLSFAFSAMIYSVYYHIKFKPDVIQAFFAVPAGGVAYILHLLFRTPYSVYLGGSDVPWGNKVRFRKLYPFISPLIKLFWSKSDYIIAPSNDILKLVDTVDPQVTHKLIKIPNGVDIEKFQKKVKKNSKVTILAVGRLIYRKGFQDLIKAIGLLKEKNSVKNIECIIIGNGDYETELRNLVKKYKLSRIVAFAGTVDYKTLVNYYLKSDVFVLPSFSEGMSLALIEAMAAKNAIVATNVSGSNEVIKENKNGLFAEVNDPASIAKQLEKLVSNKKTLIRLQNAAYKTAKQYDWVALAKRYDDLYNKMKS